MTRNIWPYGEAQAHWEEIMERAANGEPQYISCPNGVMLIMQRQENLPDFERLPRDGETVLERVKDHEQ